MKIKEIVLSESECRRLKIQESLKDEITRKTGEYLFDFLCRGLEVTPYDLCCFLCHGYFAESAKYDLLERFYYSWVHQGDRK